MLGEPLAYGQFVGLVGAPDIGIADDKAAEHKEEIHRQIAPAFPLAVSL